MAEINERDRARFRTWLGAVEKGKVQRCWFWEQSDSSNGIAARKLASQGIFEVQAHRLQNILYAVTATGLGALEVSCAACGRSAEQHEIGARCPGLAKGSTQEQAEVADVP